MAVPLFVVESPYREITRPILQYIKRLPQGPRDVVCVYIPQTVVGRWWENLLHNQSSTAVEDPASLRAGRDGGKCSLSTPFSVKP